MKLKVERVVIFNLCYTCDECDTDIELTEDFDNITYLGIEVECPVCGSINIVEEEEYC